MGDQHRELLAAIAAKNAAAARQLVAELISPGSDLLDDLAHAAAGGSDLACELLLEQLDNQRTLHRFIAGMLLDEAAIDDVAQDSLISIAASIMSFSGQSKFTTWAHRIARNRTVDHLRRQRDSAPLPDETDGEIAGPAMRMSSMIATKVSVQNALNELPELYRKAVWLRDIDGHTYAEVAAELQLSVGTVKSQISRGRAMLATKLNEHLARELR